MTPLCFIDCETTSLGLDRRAWEVAIIRRDDAGERGLLLQVADVDLADADPKSLRIGGFYDRHRRYNPPQPPNPGAPPVEATSEQLVARIIERHTMGATLVANNPAFDAYTLETLLRRHGLAGPWRYQLLDVRAMAIGWLTGLGHPVATVQQLSTDDLSWACDVPPPDDTDRHTAWGDADWVRRWYDHLTTERVEAAA